MSSPILKGFLFLLIPLVYYLTGLLNYSQAGKSGIFGFFVITAFFYWKAVFQNYSRSISLLIVVSSFLLIFFISFQAGLRDIFGVEQDSVVVIESVFNTTESESKEFLIQYRYQITKHVVFLLLSFILFLFLAFWLKDIKKGKWATINLVIFTILLVAIHFNSTMRRTNPLLFFPIYYTKWVNGVENTRKVTEEMSKNIPEDLSSMRSVDSEAERTVVWVIGESDTRHNWGLYGYERDTTPELNKSKKDLVVFKNILSADASTVASVTKMLTPASLEEPDLWRSSPDVLSIAKQAGYKVFWITNHGTDERGVLSIFASHADETIFTNKGGSRGEGTLDEALFEPYENALRDDYPKKLIIVHIMGSHPAYNFRYPEGFDHFSGLNDEVAISLKEKGRKGYAIIFRNQYDNAIRYQDFVLSALLQKLRDKRFKNAAWFYLADHGQDVSHNSNFSGHNSKSNEMWEVPMLLWASDNFFLPPKKIPSENIKYQADKVENSIFGLLHIHGNYYQKEFDIFSGSKP